MLIQNQKNVIYTADSTYFLYLAIQLLEVLLCL